MTLSGSDSFFVHEIFAPLIIHAGRALFRFSPPILVPLIFLGFGIDPKCVV